jgi:hypothetical protein
MQDLEHPPSPSNLFILFSDATGAAAALAADKVAQAVPGALLNEAVLKGKPSNFHETSAISYLPRAWLANNIGAFFSAKTSQAYS